MSIMASLYEMEEDIVEKNELGIDISELTEKEKCQLLGISCSYGICDECEVTRGVERSK